MSGPKRTIKPLPRKKRFTPEIIETFRRASELWDVAHDDDDSPERDEWIAISKRLNWTLLGLGPHCCRIEVPVGLDRRDVALVVVHVAVRRLRAGTIASHIERLLCRACNSPLTCVMTNR